MNDVLNRIEIQQGDITKQKVDAIVNAANSALAGAGELMVQSNAPAVMIS